MTKKTKKNIVKISINLVLSIISVYLFEYWFKAVLKIESPVKQLSSIGVVVMLTWTYFVAKTYYDKGTGNTGKKIIYVLLLGASTLGLVLLSLDQVSDIVYPFSGILLTSITFYMLSLSAGTLNLIGIVGIGIVLMTPILVAKWFDKITWTTLANYMEFIVFLILFIGGTWAEIRMFLHGIRGVNKDNGFGNIGDPDDGDGDTDDE